jgi:hypothetical protein
MKSGIPLHFASHEEERGPQNGVPSFGGTMKLKLIFVLMELTILLIYPFAFLVVKLRQIFNFKR